MEWNSTLYNKNNTVEIVSVAAYKVNPCIGCNSCFTRERNQCFQEDDMAKIYEKLKAADMVVIALSGLFLWD